METYTIIISVITGIAATLTLKEKTYSFFTNRFTWNRIEKSIKNLINQINIDNYNPDIILSIGRGGAIVGANISANLYPTFKPLIYWDIYYTMLNGDKINNYSVNSKNDFKNKKVLIVVGNVYSGKTLEDVIALLEKFNPIEIKSASLTKSQLAKVKVNYFAIELNKRTNMAWNFNKKGKPMLSNQ